MSEADSITAEVTRRNALGELNVREQVLDALLEKVEHDRYPSSTMMDDVERLLTPWRREDYAEILLAKMRQDRFPSRAMIERLIRLSG